jgi:hypothetical protein
MIERRHGARLALEPLAMGLVGGQQRRQHLERDAAVQARVLRHEHFPHPALAERFEDAVMADDVARCHVRGILPD